MAKVIYLKELDKIIAQTVNKTEKLLLSAYKDALLEINAKLRFTFEKYSKDGVLTRSEMYKYNRLRSLEQNIFTDIGNLANLKREELTKLSSTSFTTAHALNFTTVAANITDLSFAYAHPNQNLINASVQNKIDKMTLNQRLTKHGTEIKAKISREITQGLTQGESYYKISKRIKESLDGDMKKASNVARTESHRNQMAGRFQSMKDLKEQHANIEKEWMTVGDNRVRPRHQDLDGVTVPINQPFEIGGYEAMFPGDFGTAELDCRCRCNMVTVVL